MYYTFLPTLGLAAILVMAAPISAQPGLVPMDQIIGINTRASDPVRYVRSFKNVREYHLWSDDVGDAPSTTALCPDDFNAGANPQYLRYRFNPSFNNAALIQYDDYYRALYQRAVPVLQGLAPIMRGYNSYPFMAPHLLEQKPFCLTGPYQWTNNGATPPANLLPLNQGNPNLYRSHALWATLHTARFGSRAFASTSKYHTKFLFDHYVSQGWHSAYDDLTERDPARNGLGYVRYLECGNEPEKSWYDPWWAISPGLGQTFFQATAPQYAAQLSADFDGHGRSAYFRIASMPDTLAWLGIRNTDPDLKVVFAGLADFRGKYVEDVINWCRANRQPGVNGFLAGPVLPFDVLSFHHYSTTFSSVDAYGTNSLAARYADINGVPIAGQGISPEADNLRGEIRYLASRLEQFEPGLASKELWLTEFGYDSDGLYSSVRVPDIAGQDRQTTQAQWLVRSFLELAATRRVSKAMLYELRDEPNLANANFGYCGLLTADYRPKRAWYYVQTLKNVLAGYTFAPENPDQAYVSATVAAVTSDNAGAAADTRVYQFTRDDEADIYAIWSPTATGLAYRAALRFAPGQSFAEASLVTIADLDETGRWTNWSDSISTDAAGHTVIRGLPVSETPVFLVVNTSRHDGAIAPALALQAQALCCGAVRLSWQNDTLHERYRIFYGKKSTLGPASPFNYTRANLKLFPEEVGGRAGSVVVPGLPANSVYRFYVVPVGPDGQPPENWSQWPVFADAYTGNCNGCLIDITPMQLTYGANLPLPPQVLNLLSADHAPNQCAETMATGVSNNWDDWDWSTNDPQARTLTIDLLQPYRLDVVYLLDAYGKGQLRLEAKRCDCDQWQILADLTLNTDYDRWMHLANLRPEAVRYLRITRLEPGAQVRKIFFCGQPETCSVNASGGPPASAVEALVPREIAAQRAMLSWTTAPFDPDRPQLGQATQYRIRYSSSWLPDGTLIAPREEYAAAGMWDRTAEYELVDLQPGTAYRAEVRPVLGPAGCSAAPAIPVNTEFTTIGGPVNLATAEGRTAEASSSADRHAAASVRLHPNPATSTVQVTAATAGYTRLRVHEAARGALAFERQIAPEEKQWTLDIGTLPAGTYVVRLEGPAGMAMGKLVVVW